MTRSIHHALLLIIGILILTGTCAQTNAQSSSYLSAEESDPRKLGWMTGFPLPAEKLIMQPESDFFSFPKLRWTVCHIRELMPTKQVKRGIGPPVPISLPADQAVAEYLMKE